MAKKTMPTARTTPVLKAKGYECGVVERWVPCKGHPGGGIRKDFFGCIDIIAVKDEHTFGIQVTSRAGRQDHKYKIELEPRAILWLNAGNHILLITWGKMAKKGGKVGAKQWTMTCERAALRGTEIEWQDFGL